MVATPSDTSSSTGIASCTAVILRATARQRATNRVAPGSSRVASSWKSSSATRPGHRSGSSAAGSPGSVKRNLRHSCTRWNRAANIASSSSSWRLELGLDEPVGGGRSTRRTRGRGAQVPRAGGVDVERLGDGGAHRAAGALDGRPQVLAGPRADPDARRVLGEPEEAELGAQTRARRAVARRVDERQPPPAVPHRACRAGRSGRRRRRVGARPGRSPGSPGRRAA